MNQHKKAAYKLAKSFLTVKLETQMSYKYKYYDYLFSYFVYKKRERMISALNIGNFLKKNAHFRMCEEMAIKEVFADLRILRKLSKIRSKEPPLNCTSFPGWV